MTTLNKYGQTLPIIPTMIMPTMYATKRIQQGMSVHDLHMEKNENTYLI